MIVKSLSRKRLIGVAALLRYIGRSPNGRAHDPILWNLETERDDLGAIRREFLANARYAPSRKGGVVLYHEILSLSPKDRGAASANVLEDLALHYLERRAMAGGSFLAYGQVHMGPAPHVHLMIGANVIRGRKKVRLSRAQFAEAKQELEAYQRDRYPGLEHSRVDHGRRRRRGVVLTKAEDERARRQRHEKARPPSRKEALARVVSQSFIWARSEGEWARLLRAASLSPYRRGRSVGVVQEGTGRRFRLRTLGLEEAYERARARWEILPGRSAQLERSTLERFRKKVRGLGFREDVALALGGLYAGLSEEARGKALALEETLARGRQRRRERLPSIEIDHL